MADMMERFIESTRAFYPAQGLTNVQDYGGIGTSCQSYVAVNNSYGAPMWSKIFVSCNLCAHICRIDWLQSLKQIFINVSFHILVASLTLMALF